MASSNKTVFIMGSTRSIGHAFAEYYVKAGWRVIGTARASSSTEKLAALSPFKIITLDASDEESVFEAARQVDGIPIDLLINNAGVGIPGCLATATKDEFMRQFEVNAVGPFLVTQALLPNMKLAAKANGSASIAQISSFMGSIGSNTAETTDYFSQFYGYSASKVALNMITRTMAIKLRASNIVAVALHPGYMITEMTQNQGAVTHAESAATMADIVAKLTPADAGKFLDADSQAPAAELPW